MNISAVVLCAGKGTRMLPLTETRPKPLQVVAGKSLLAWKLDALPDAVNEIVLVIGHQGDQIQNEIRDKWNGKTVRYVIQKELNGTAGALLAAKDILPERFLVLNGDDLYANEDMEKLMALDWGICVTEILNKEMKGEVLTNSPENFIGINEEVHFVKQGYANTGLYMLRHEILNIPPVPIGGSSTEFGLPHTLAVIAKHTPVQLIKTNKWMQITTPEDLKNAENLFDKYKFI